MLSVLEAAELMDEVYNRPGPGPSDTILNDAGVEAAHLIERRALVIEGTNEQADWVLHKFNLFGWRQPESELAGEMFHAGFHDDAVRVLDFARPLAADIDVVVGHSLGGAAAQIVGAVLNVPTIAFGSPRPWRRRNWRKVKAPMTRAKVHVVNRTDDRVACVPPGPIGGFLPVPFFDFAQIGTVHEIAPPLADFGEDHRIDKYVALLRTDVHAELAATPIDQLEVSRWVA